MIRIIHCSDIHISVREEEYSFSVLDEIINLTNKFKATHLVLSGDVFDSFHDMEKTRNAFAKRIDRLDPKIKTIFISGNHEMLGMGMTDISRFVISDNANFISSMDGKCRLIFDQGIEFLLMPYQGIRRGFVDPGIPGKKHYRMAIFHGTITGMSFNGIDCESDPWAIDAGVFTNYSVDYAAMGHIHAKKSGLSGKTRIEYPGSARVWRKNEPGEHGINIIEIGNDVKVQFLPLESAGCYRDIELPLNLDGTIDPDRAETSSWGRSDWINIIFTGLVEDEKTVLELQRRIENKYSSLARKLTFERNVDILSGISENLFAKKFLEILDKKKSFYDEKMWLKMRVMGLNEIKNILEAGK